MLIEQSGGPHLLLSRMRTGDRLAAAEFINRFGPRIRRRIKGKLGVSMRRLFDSAEIMSTLGRRLDEFVRSGQIRASSEAELWGLVFRIADNALVEKARVFQSVELREGEDSPIAHAVLDRLRKAELNGERIEIDQALRALATDLDREILSLWLMGKHAGQIAECVGLSPEVVRKRWQKILKRLRETCDPEV